MLRHDFNLDFAIQNPLVTLSAFQEAFGQKNDVRLVCFLINVNKQSEDYKALVAAFSNEKNAIIVEGAIDDNYYSYLHHAHCFISLHQETMFGYPLAEAMSLGKYVVATNNGGNTEYMNHDNSFLVDLTSEKELPFEAAKILKSIYNDSNMLNTKSKQARLHIQKHFSPSSVGFIMQKRLEKKLSLLVCLCMKFKRAKQKRKNMKSIINLLLKNAYRPAVLE
jgi:glycosyltransferase involved in cell wall biosynthesis